MRQRLRSMMVFAVLIGLGCQVGCNDPVARRETARRQKRIALWLGEAAERERIGSARVKAALREAGRIWQQDAARTRQNDRELRDLISWEQRRWQRRQPAFRARIERELAGKPEHARPTAVRMFF